MFLVRSNEFGLLGVVVFSSAIGLSLAISISNCNFSGISGDVVGLRMGLQGLACCSTVAWRAIESRVRGVTAPKEESSYQTMFKWFKYYLIIAMNKLLHGEHRARWVTISNDEYESMKSTIEVLSDNELLRQIQESREDYRRGRFKKLSELIDS
ncbi:MAG: hypothetical protein C5S48_08605 [Candidatus Methanogaster sp.]|nr:MAG: hypothetical protein C5S48_08605 [ANME-2 cluster archaeon]